MEVLVDINDYLTAEEQKEIVKEAFQERICLNMHSNRFEIDRQINKEISEIISRTFEDDGIVDDIVDKTISAIDKIDAFTVFSRGFDITPSTGYEILQEAIATNKEIINKKVEALILSLPIEDLKIHANQVISDKVYEAIFGIKRK